MNRIIAIALLLFSCITPAANCQDAANLSKSTIQLINRSVFEVVTPKIPDPGIKYNKPLDPSHLPFSQRNDNYLSIGTAFSIAGNHFISAAHVFDLQTTSVHKDFAIRDQNRRVRKITRILRYSKYRDLVEFEIENVDKGAPFLTLSESTSVADTVYSVGNALGEGISFRNGQIASYTSEPIRGFWKFIRFSAPASPGNSGGPLLNTKGQVVGVITMKNSTENLNYAIPIRELKALSNKQAEFESLKVALPKGDREVSSDWRFVYPLPSPLKNLAEAAQQSLIAFYTSLGRKYKAELERLDYNNPLFVNYLRTQTGSGSYISRVVQASSDAPFKLEPIFLPTNAPIANGGKFFLGSWKNETAWLQYFRPKNISLRMLYSNPGLYMDEALKTYEFYRVYGSDKLRITSLGKPSRMSRWEDRIGRTWLSATWDLNYQDAFIESNCLMVPAGLTCFIREALNATIVGGRELAHNFADMSILAYTGTIDQWREYLNLPIYLIGPSLRHATIEIDATASYVLNLGDLSIKFTNGEISGSSELAVGGAYSRTVKSSEDICIIELRSVAAAHVDLLLEVAYSPSPNSGRAAQESWLNMARGVAPFNEVPQLSGELLISSTVIQKTGREPASSGFDRPIFKTHCRVKKDSITPTQLVKQCRALKDSIALK